MNNKQKPVVYILSDSTGETAELLALAAVSQFNSGNIEIRRVPYVSAPEEILEIIDGARKTPSVIAYTLVRPELQSTLAREARFYGIPVVDLLGPMIEALSQITPVPPRLEPGLIHRTDQAYFRRVEAIEFAVRYDDARDPRGILKADVVVLGVSRTGKTPLCIYLGHKGIKAANVPLVPEVPPPREIYQVPPYRLVGLTISPDLLNEIRRERLKSLGLVADAEYASRERIVKELAYAEQIMNKTRCSVIDITNKAVEETASRVMEIYYRRERQAKGGKTI